MKPATEEDGEMARIVLVTGGCRSGKSAFAQSLAESLPGRRVFIATCPVVDEEMRQRIRRHQEARASGGWDTIEELVRLEGALLAAGDYEIVLVDCLTVWINNLMYQARQLNGQDIGEEQVVQWCDNVLAGAGKHPGTVIFVSHEVGMGIVPENALARHYRDLVGRCNQAIAAGADVVALVSCGIPLFLKGSTHELAARND
jgi:adenosylcobinamide kinase/adenosylcobinamide-phosphate guanylyltransferase